MSVQLPTRLEELLGPTHVLVDAGVVDRYVTDWTGRWSGRALCVVRPGSTAQVADVLEACRQDGAGVVVQGGNTGLVGGATPRDGDVVLSTERLTQLGPVDELRGQVTVGAGVPLEEAEAHVAEHGWSVGVDLASRSRATIGGMAATDAGGTRAVAHGSMRARVLGLEAVLADGTVVTPWMQGLPKDTAGLDLRALLVGSEGTLAVITAVRLQLVRQLTTRATALLGIAPDAVSTAVAAVRDWSTTTGVTLTACELLTREGTELVEELTGTVSPLVHDTGLLVEVAGPPLQAEPLKRLMTMGIGDPVLAQDAADRRRMWQSRELHTEALATLGTPLKLDVAVPVDQLTALLTAIHGTVATAVPGARTIVFGHAAEGNMHVNVLGAEHHPGAVERAVFELVSSLGGTVSAEHGIGRAKVDHLHLTRDPGSIVAMQRIKAALDPDGLLGPGVVLPVTAP